MQTARWCLAGQGLPPTLCYLPLKQYYFGVVTGQGGDVHSAWQQVERRAAFQYMSVKPTGGANIQG